MTPLVYLRDRSAYAVSGWTLAYEEMCDALDTRPADQNSIRILRWHGPA